MPKKSEFGALRLRNETVADFKAFKFAYESTHLQKETYDSILQKMLDALAASDPATLAAYQIITGRKPSPQRQEPAEPAEPAPSPSEEKDDNDNQDG